MTHTVKFVRNCDDNTYRAMCSCGWHMQADSLLECQTVAAVHDLNTAPIQESPPIVPGFVTGLPDVE